MIARTNQAERSIALNHMWNHFPGAHGLRHEGKCQHCRGRYLWSCIVGDPPVYTVDDVAVQDAGYFCSTCRWSNAGSRTVEYLP